MGKWCVLKVKTSPLFQLQPDLNTAGKMTESSENAQLEVDYDSSYESDVQS